VPNLENNIEIQEKILEKYRSGGIDPITEIWWNFNRQKIWKNINDTISDGDMLLDVGCGTGQYIVPLAKRKINCFGIDPLKSSIKRSQDHANSENVSNVPLFLGNGEYLPFKDKSFNVVLCLSTLQHVVDQKKTLDEIRRVLKNEGSLIIQIPTDRNASTFFRRMKTPSHYTKGFNAKNIKIILEDNFEIQKMEGSGFLPPFSMALFRFYYKIFKNGIIPKFIISKSNYIASIWQLSASTLIIVCKSKKYFFHK